MGKKNITRYFEPLTPEDREEIKELLKPILEEKERWKIAKGLQFQLLDSVNDFLNRVTPNFSGNSFADGDAFEYLNKKLQKSANNWYSEYAPRIGTKIRPEDIYVSISKDGLYILTYSDTLKSIITKADFELETFTWNFPTNENELIQAINEELETKSVEE